MLTIGDHAAAGEETGADDMLEEPEPADERTDDEDEDDADEDDDDETTPLKVAAAQVAAAEAEAEMADDETDDEDVGEDDGDVLPDCRRGATNQAKASTILHELGVAATGSEAEDIQLAEAALRAHKQTLRKRKRGVVHSSYVDREWTVPAFVIAEAIEIDGVKFVPKYVKVTSGILRRLYDTEVDTFGWMFGRAKHQKRSAALGSSAFHTLASFTSGKAAHEEMGMQAAFAEFKARGGPGFEECTIEVFERMLFWRCIETERYDRKLVRKIVAAIGCYYGAKLGIHAAVGPPGWQLMCEYGWYAHQAKLEVLERMGGDRLFDAEDNVHAGRMLTFCVTDYDGTIVRYRFRTREQLIEAVMEARVGSKWLHRSRAVGFGEPPVVTRRRAEAWVDGRGDPNDTEPHMSGGRSWALYDGDVRLCGQEGWCEHMALQLGLPYDLKRQQPAEGAPVAYGALSLLQLAAAAEDAHRALFSASAGAPGALRAAGGLAKVLRDRPRYTTATFAPMLDGALDELEGALQSALPLSSQQGVRDGVMVLARRAAAANLQWAMQRVRPEVKSAGRLPELIEPAPAH